MNTKHFKAKKGRCHLQEEEEVSKHDQPNRRKDQQNTQPRETNHKRKNRFNGKVQRVVYTKEKTASPTVSQVTLFLTSIIDAIMGRDKTIMDITGAYPNEKMED